MTYVYIWMAVVTVIVIYLVRAVLTLTDHLEELVKYVDGQLLTINKIIRQNSNELHDNLYLINEIKNKVETISTAKPKTTKKKTTKKDSE